MIKKSSIILLLIVFYTIIFISGMFFEYKFNLFKHKDVSMEVTELASKEINYFELKEEVLYNNIYDFVMLYSSNKNQDYVTEVTDGFIKLFNKLPNDTNKQNIIYFVALCSVESNFKMKSKSTAGAYGISQVMWSIWHKVIQENYNVTKEEFYNSIEDNIYVGYRIFRNYWVKADYNLKGACHSYLGAKSSSYVNKINSRYVYLVNSILKDTMYNGLKTKEIYCNNK